MDTQTPNSNPSKNDLLAMLDSDNFDLNFTALNEGLGFNKEEEKSEIIKQKSLQKKKSRIVNPVKTERNVNRRELQAFYEQSDPQEFSLQTLLTESNVKKESKTVQPLKPQKEKEFSKFNDLKDIQALSIDQLQVEKETTPQELVQEEREIINEKADFGFRFFAYLVDLIIVVAAWAITLLSLSFVAKLQLVTIKDERFMNEIITYISVLLLSFYVFYFTFMDTTRNSTIGKSIVNIRVRTKAGDRADVIRTFMRSLMTLLSLPLLGLPVLFGVNDFMSGTRVYKSNDY